MTITNITIQKLTIKELNDLDCLSTLGLGLYQGELKAKVKVGGKFVNKVHTPEAEIFDLEGWQAQFIRLADQEKIPRWAFRIWDKETKAYTKPWNLLMALNFIK